MNRPRHSIRVAQSILYSWVTADPDEQKTIVICGTDTSDPIGVSTMGAANVLHIGHEITDVRWLFDIESKLQTDVVIVIWANDTNTDEEFARLKEALAKRGPNCVPVIQCNRISIEDFVARSGIDLYLNPDNAYPNAGEVEEKKAA